MTWSAQSRMNSTEKTVSASTPRIAMRSAIWGVTRYGSSTRGSGGRKRGSLPERLDRSGHLPPPPRRDAENTADECDQRVSDQEIEGEGRQQDSDEERNGADGRAEHEMEDGRAESKSDRRKRDGDELRLRRRTRRHLAEAPREITHQREEERGEPERLERRHIEDQPSREPGHRPEDRAAQKRDPDDENEHEVGVAFSHLGGGEDGNLEETGEQEKRGGLDGVGDRHFFVVAFGFGRSTSTITSE